MGKNHKEKENIKFGKDLIDKVSQNTRLKWRRHNFSIGQYRNDRKKILVKIIDKEVKQEIEKL